MEDDSLFDGVPPSILQAMMTRVKGSDMQTFLGVDRATTNAVLELNQIVSKKIYLDFQKGTDAEMQWFTTANVQVLREFNGKMFKVRFESGPKHIDIALFVSKNDDGGSEINKITVGLINNKPQDTILMWDRENMIELRIECKYNDKKDIENLEGVVRILDFEDLVTVLGLAKAFNQDGFRRKMEALHTNIPMIPVFDEMLKIRVDLDPSPLSTHLEEMSASVKLGNLLAMKYMLSHTLVGGSRRRRRVSKKSKRNTRSATRKRN